VKDSDGMRVDHDSELIKVLLTERGFLVESVEPSPVHKTPDLAVSIECQRVLIEVEAKSDDKQIRDLLHQEKGATLSYRGGRVEDRIRAAWRQVRDFPRRQDADNTLIWFLAYQGAAALFSGQAAHALLYGIEDLEGYTLNGVFYSKPCYFMDNSLFFREQQLDAVVIHTLSSLELCLNPFSPRYETFRSSPFVEVLKGLMPLVDPLQEEREGHAFIANCEIDRQDMHAVVRFVKSKYQLESPRIYRYPLFNYPV
jgi:hypothetical protein